MTITTENILSLLKNRAMTKTQLQDVLTFKAKKKGHHRRLDELLSSLTSKKKIKLQERVSEQKQEDGSAVVVKQTVYLLA